jgi:predicted transcriptional regulator of viral defense system
MKEEILEKFEESPYFTKTNLKLFQDNSDFSFDKNIQNWLKKGLIKKLKNGLYCTEKYFLKEKEPTLYQEFIANKLVFPSYLSGEYVLQKDNILTEAIYSITSVTIKSTRNYENFLATFRYYNIKKELFLGFQEINFGKNKILIATRAKALFDFIYLKKNNFQEFSQKEIEEIRLNLDEIKKEDLKEFKKYIDLSKDKKMLNFYKNIC